MQTGSWQELVLPDPSKYISAEMAHRRNQGVTSITWLLAQPINIKNDVSIGQARLLNTSSEPGAPCWVQVRSPLLEHLSSAHHACLVILLRLSAKVFAESCPGRIALH